VLTGLGTSGGLLGRLLEPFKIDYRTQKRRVLTFVLDGKATLPPLESLPLSPIADPSFVANAASADRGAVTFGYSCGVCHGYEGISAGIAPDLRASEIPQDAETFASIVRDGGLVSAGMPRFDDFSAQQLADIRQYIRTRADDFRKGRDAAPHVSAAAGP
ncbi:MAG: c-type cytochrome, partial [Caulobacterales bacterium]